MLVELAACNAAFSIIKETVQNGGDLLAAGQHLFSFFDNKSALQKNLNKKGASSDLEEFFALEQIKQKEAELKEMMIYSGRGGLWDDWLYFQAQARRKREQAAAQEAAKRLRKLKKIRQVVDIVLAVIIASLGVAAASSFVWIILTRGNL